MRIRIAIVWILALIVTILVFAFVQFLMPVPTRIDPLSKEAGEIITALIMYSGETGGQYPDAEIDSNAALQMIFPDPYELEGSWSYVSGLTDSAPGSTPIIMEGPYNTSTTRDQALIGFLDGCLIMVKQPQNVKPGEPWSLRSINIGNHTISELIARVPGAKVLDPLPKP